MSPGYFLIKEISIKDLSTEVIQKGNQNPSLLGIWRPPVMGSIMLDKSTNGSGDYLAVM
jgi:hypothetical protein